MTRVATRIGPADHGRGMSLADFDRAETEEGHLYELSRGIVTVSDIPDLKHKAQLEQLRDDLVLYRATHRHLVHSVSSGSECKILLEDLQSERHPDLSVYKQPPLDREDLWATWVPELVVEIVSERSRVRDYEEKPEEYLKFGVSEYWIVDYQRREVTVLRRIGGRWSPRVLKDAEAYHPRLLPGFEMNVARLFAAADSAP